MVCYRLGTMLHLYTQKGKEAMNTSDFQKDIGGTATYMKRLAIYNKMYLQLT